MKDRTYRKKFLVIDDAHILETHNLRRKVHQAAKHPDPILRMDAPWDRQSDMLNFMNVIRDEDEGIFKMWYCVVPYLGELRCGQVRLAYATSDDGIHWQRPELGLVEVNGSRKNNYILPELNVCPAIIKDPSDIPQRRYKMLFTFSGTETVWAKFYKPVGLAYSADGIRWDRPVHVNPVLRGLSDGPYSLIYDADRRKYAFFTRRVPNLPRDISLYESYDLVNWQDKGRVLVPGDDRDPPEMYNFYYMTPFRYEDFFLSAVSAQYTSPISESYDSYNRPPNHRNSALGHVEIQLAYSRNGRTWHRPDDRTPLVPWGPEGSYDSGGLYPAQNPIVIDGRTLIYYMAECCHHSQWDYSGINAVRPARDAAFGMLATMPEDRWVSLDADAKGGSLLTKPVFFAADETLESPRELLINADAAGGSIQAELITPFGQVVEGFSRGDSVPITSDGKDQPLRWKGNRSPGKTIADHLGGLCIKFYLKGAGLYSYATNKADGEGKVAEYYANLRWCETIKHRSGNWDRLSTEPAGGLPPHGGPGPQKGQEKPGEIVPDF